MLLRLTKISGLILASSLFFPISCSTSIVATTHIIAQLDARDISEGDEPFPQAFNVLVYVPSSPLMVVPLSELDRFKVDKTEFRFLLPNKEGELSEGQWIEYKYTVDQLAPYQQLINVWFQDDDVSYLSRYIAEEGTITPLYAERLVPGYMFGAIPFALAFAFLIKGGGGFLVRRNASAHKKKKASHAGTEVIIGVALLLIAIVNSNQVVI